jgi:hypothetical protein
VPEGTIDLEHFLETHVLEPLENPFGTKVLPNVSGLDRRRVSACDDRIESKLYQGPERPIEALQKIRGENPIMKSHNCAP